MKTNLPPWKNEPHEQRDASPYGGQDCVANHPVSEYREGAQEEVRMNNPGASDSLLQLAYSPAQIFNF
jgi:hypothetical protein